jgi:ureidoglycolate lyase
MFSRLCYRSVVIRSNQSFRMPLLDLPVHTLTAEAFAPYGAMWGRPYGHDEPAFTNPATDFWHQHFFEAGADGKTEVLWVNYRRNDGVIDTLEVHWLTEQAIVPLGPEGIVQVVALSDTTGKQPDLSSLKAFAVPAGQGVCMRPGCWHATQVLDGEVRCLMLTRASTTVDLVDHLTRQTPAAESALQPVEPRRLLRIK